MTVEATKPVAIVTGAASGIGRDIAKRLLQEGWLVVVCDIAASLEEEYREEVADNRATVRVIDIANSAAPELIVRAALDTYGRIDGLVNNAGTGGPNATVEKLDMADLRRTLEINVVGAVALTQAALPALKSITDTKQHAGSIVNIGSLFATEPVVEGAAYCMSKAAIHTLTHVLALENGPEGIRANTVAPGFIMTPMHEEEVAAQAKALGMDEEERLLELREEVPLRRHGYPNDIAAVVSWLLGQDSGYVSGQTIHVDGGIHLS